MVWLQLCKTKFSENSQKMQNMRVLHFINQKSKYTVCDWGPCSSKTNEWPFSRKRANNYDYQIAAF